jgi:hypothetical protein
MRPGADGHEKETFLLAAGSFVADTSFLRRGAVARGHVPRRAVAPCTMPYPLCLLGAMLVALCSSADAQQAQRLNKIGRLSAGSSTDPLSKASYDAFRGGMRDLGWFERKNLVYENRWVGDKPENARSLAAELAGLKVDVIVAVGRHRIPTVFPWRIYVEEGGLMSYSADVLDMHRRYLCR